MCFSSPASFAASAGLLVIGSVALIKANHTHHRIFACMPLIFAVQQFSEGWLWLSMDGIPNHLMHAISMYTFLVFAQVVWPVFVPLSILLLEKKPHNKEILGWLSGLGVLTAAYMGFCLVYYPVSAGAESHHIRYSLGAPEHYKIIGGIAYLLATVLAPVVSDTKILKLFGLVLLISYIVTGIFYQDYLLSVWCYFAATLSVLVVLIVNNLNKRPLLS